MDDETDRGRARAARAAVLQGYVDTETRVLGEAREREARKVECGADFNAWLRETVYPMIDPMLRQRQQQFPFARREARPDFAMRVMFDDGTYFEFAAARNRTIRVSWHRDGALPQPATYADREDLDVTRLAEMFSELTIVSRPDS